MQNMMDLLTNYLNLPSMTYAAANATTSSSSSSSSGIIIKASIEFNNETLFYAHFLSLYCIVMWVIVICYLIVVEAAASASKEEEEDKNKDKETLELDDDEEEDNMLAHNHNAAAAAAAEGGGAGKQDISEREKALLQGSARAKEWATQRKKKKSQQGEGGQESRYQKSLQEVIIFGAKAMRSADIRSIFLNPVTDTIAPGYSTIIKEPMCIRIIEEKAEKMEYKNLCEFEHDVRLMFDNCIKYNNCKEGKWFQEEAKKQKKAWERKILPKVRDLQYKKGYW
mmetsp:Transcript_10625/g.21447  ORF Transcript_10625/g.21447 Transcript_10625/m.21447 type:complete len:282 (+) Transcript_10625:1948-2793(+)